MATEQAPTGAAEAHPAQHRLESARLVGAAQVIGASHRRAKVEQRATLAPQHAVCGLEAQQVLDVGAAQRRAGIAARATGEVELLAAVRQVGADRAA